MGHGIVKLYCFNVSIERCRGTLFCARCPGTHHLGHSFASYLTMGGENLRPVQTLLGHKEVRMTVRYRHPSPEHLREAARNLDKILVAVKEEGEGIAK